MDTQPHSSRMPFILLPKPVLTGLMTFLLLVISFLAFISLSHDIHPVSTPLSAAHTTIGKLPLRFEQNMGQTDDKVQFLSRNANYTFFATEDEAILSFSQLGKDDDDTILSMQVVNQQQPFRFTGTHQSISQTHYLLGKNANNWTQHIPTYHSIISDDVYPGIDLRYHSEQQQLEYDFIVQPGAKPEQIQLSFNGQSSLTIDEQGRLVFQLGKRTLHHQKPIIYQDIAGQRHHVDGEYKLTNADGKTVVSFEVAAYDKNHALIIDPIIDYASYFGGEANDRGLAIAVDQSGSVYIAGTTRSALFPSQNPYQASLNGSRSTFIAKLTPSGDDLVYATYLGGSGDEADDDSLESDYYVDSDVDIDVGKDITVDALGQLYIIGNTNSHQDFPIINAIQPNYGGGRLDSYIAKLSADGSQLLFSTYFGGNKKDKGFGISLKDDRLFVTGMTRSRDFPLSNAYQSQYGGKGDAFVAQLASDGSQLYYSSYLGGKKYDAAKSIAVTSSNEATVTGITESKTNFPLFNALQSAFGGGKQDAFVTQFTADGDAVIFSTFLGGKKKDKARAIAIDSQDQIIITGLTASNNFPTYQAYQNVYAGKDDGFISKLDATGDQLLFSTYLGGNKSDSLRGVTIDSRDDIYVVGTSKSTQGLPEVDAVTPLLNNSKKNIYLAKLLADGSDIDFASYLGGKRADFGYDIAVDDYRNIYLTGTTKSDDDFPSNNALQAVFGGKKDAFIIKIAEDVVNLDPEITSTPVTVAYINETYQYQIIANDPDNDPLTYQLDNPPAGMTINGNGLITWQPNTLGSYTISVTVDDGKQGQATQSYTLVVTTRNQAPQFSSSPITIALTGQNYQYDAEAIDPDNDTVTYSLAVFPTGMTIDTQTGLINWTPAQAGTNAIVIVADDGQGNTSQQSFDIIVTNPDIAPPVISALSPADGSFTNQSVLTLSGQVNEAATVTVNGIAATVDSNLNFVSAPVSLSDGLNQLNVIATDASNNVSTSTVSITLDTLAPTLIIDSPADGTVINQTTIDIAGSLNEPVSSVTLNGSQVTVDANNQFIGSVTLTEGSNSITITAIDLAGNTRSVPLDITVDSIAPDSPDLSLIQRGNPANNIVMVSGQAGSAEAGTLLHLTNTRTNFKVTTLIQSDGSFSTDIAAFANDNFSLYLVDSAGNQSDSVTLVTSSPLSLTLEPIGDRVMPLGQISRFTVIANDSDSDVIQLGITPVPLPDNMNFNIVTGEFSFRPKANQIGDIELTFSAQTGDELVTETITITVPTPDAASPTVLQGRLLDANGMQNDIIIPIVGATVSFLGTGVSATTDIQGYFTLTDLPDSADVFDIDTSTAIPAPGGVLYTAFREQYTLEKNVINLVERPFYLPRLDESSLTQILPTQTTIVENTELGITLPVEANNAFNENGTPFVGQISISEVPRDLAPENLPAELDPTLLFTIQPVGVEYVTPAPITMRNTEGHSPGSELDIWSVDPDKGEFVVVGTGRVTSDGSQIVTISGGIRANDWHMTIPPEAATTTDNAQDQDKPDECDGGSGGNGGSNSGNNQPGGSSFCMHTGSMSTGFTLPAYRSLEASRALNFSYRSSRAYPRPVIEFNGQISARSTVPETVSYRLEIAGLQQGQEFFIDTSNFNESVDEVFTSAVTYDGANFDTGLYDYRLQMTANFRGGSRRSTFFEGQSLVINEQQSVFGAGWKLGGLHYLVFNLDNSIGLAFSSGNVVTYRPTDTNPDIFNSPASDYATFVRNTDGSYTHTEKNGIKHHFNAQGLLLERVDRNGNITAYGYDNNGKVIAITDPVGLVTRLVYDTNGFLSTVTDPANRVTRFEFDLQGNMTKVTFPDGTFETFEYDERHLMTAHEDERQNRFEDRYDVFGRVINATLPDGTVRAVAGKTSAALIDLTSGFGTQANPAQAIRQDDATGKYVDGRGNFISKTMDSHGRTLMNVDELGRVTEYVRDDNSNATQTTRPIGSVVNRTFDSFGNILTSTEAFNGATTTYTYDQFSLITSVTNPRNHTTNINRDPVTGNPLSTVNHLGHTATMTYDTRGLITQTISPNGLVTDYSYNTQGLMATKTETPPATSPGNIRVTSYNYFPTGLLQSVTTPDGITLNYSYDERSMLTSVVDNLGQSVIYSYDEHKNIIKTETSNSNGTLALLVNNIYDNRNRLITTSTPHVDAELSETIQILDENSNLISLTDPNGNNNSNTYDAFNRLIANTHREGGITQYEYDAQDRIIKVIAPNGTETHYEYDIISRRTKEISADRGEISYSYDLANNVIAITEGRGITTNLSYDGLERLITKTYPNTIAGKLEDVSYTYDSCDFGLGYLCARIDESGTYSYQYDAYGNLTQSVFTEIAGISYTTAYQYDDGDNLSQTTLPSGRIINYQRDGVRRIERVDTTVNGAAQNIVRDIQYRGDNQMTQCTFGNDLIDTRNYDLQGRLTDQLLATANNVIIDQRLYSYDKNSNIIAIDTNDEDNAYSYDKLDRLTSDTINNDLPFNFNYDQNHNRLFRAKSDLSLQSTYQYQQNSNRLSVQETVQQGNTPLPAIANRQFVYNDVGRLFQLIEDGVLKAEYIYNDAGLRTRKTTYLSDGITIDKRTIYHYDQMGYLVTETSEQGELIKDYIWQEGMTPLAQIDNILGIESVSYLYTDHLMTNRLATDNNQSIIWQWEGEAFGNTPAVALAGINVNLRFPGQYYDQETNLNYNHNRYYDPSLSRYITSDPIGLLGGDNTYQYVSGNPLVSTDPSGLLCVTSGTLTIPHFAEKVGQPTYDYGNWYIHLISIHMKIGTSTTSIGSTITTPYIGKCFFKRDVIEKQEYKRMGTELSWGYCSDCGDFNLWSRERQVLIEKWTKSTSTKENKTSIVGLSEPTGITANQKCRANTPTNY